MSTETQEERDALAQKAIDIFEEVAESNAQPVEDGVDPGEPKRWKIGEALVDIDLPTATGSPGRTVIDGVDVSGVTYGVKVESFVGSANKVTLYMHYVPARIHVLGTVEIVDSDIHTPEQADEIISRPSNFPPDA